MWVFQIWSLSCWERCFLFLVYQGFFFLSWNGVGFCQKPVSLPDLTICHIFTSEYHEDYLKLWTGDSYLPKGYNSRIYYDWKWGKTLIIHLWTSSGDAVTTNVIQRIKKEKSCKRIEKENVTLAKELILKTRTLQIFIIIFKVLQSNTSCQIKMKSLVIYTVWLLISVYDIYLYEFIEFIREKGYNIISIILPLFRKRNVNVSIKMWRASLVAQWLRIRLPMQGTRVRALVREHPTCCGATKPASHNYWAHVPQLLKPACLEPVFRNKRSHHNEKPMHHNEE